MAMIIDCREEVDMILAALRDAKRVDGNMPRERFYRVLKMATQRVDEKARNTHEYQLVENRQ